MHTLLQQSQCVLLKCENQFRFRTNGKISYFAQASGDGTQNIVTDYLTLCIVNSVYSCAAVEKHGFRNMIHAVNSMLKIPRRYLWRWYVLECHTKLRDRVGALTASSAASVPLACNAFSSRVFKRYVAISLHLVDNNWAMQSSPRDFV